MKISELKNIRYLQTIAFIDHEGFDRLDIFDPGNLLGIKFEQTIAFLEQDTQDQVKTTCHDTDGNDAFQFAELFTFFDEMHG